MRLSWGNLTSLPRSVELFSYDRASQAVGIVHLGIGAFHRAHQAWYTDAAMNAGCRHWMITGVSLRSRETAVKLNPQGGLYTIGERSASGTDYRVVGAVHRVLASAPARDQTPGVIATGATRIVSLTITEKGYCRGPDGHLDLAAAQAPASPYAVLAKGLSRRRGAGLAGLTILSCDNLMGNGALMARLMAEYCEAHDPSLGCWIEAECTFPNSMVDRIVPSMTQTDLMQVDSDIGVTDPAAVLTEPFSQWVIEDNFAAGRPAWEKVGVQLVSSAEPYEMAKLRMLNGAHSALAYLGLALGHTYVHEAVADPLIIAPVKQLMTGEAAASLTPAPGQDLGKYAEALLARFANPSLRHRLAQIAIDGSQKIPQRWLPVLAFHGARGEACPALLKAVAAWFRHVRGYNGMVEDPLAAELQRAWFAGGRDGIVEAVFGPGGIIRSAWQPTPYDCSFISRQLANM